MRTMITIIISAILVSLPLSAEEGARTGGLADTFKKLDANSDGKVTKAEANNAAWFDSLDRNKDGVLTTDEISSLNYSGRTNTAQKRPASKEVSSNATPFEQLAKKSHELCLIAASAPSSIQFFKEGVGLAMNEAKGGGSLRMLLFRTGESHIKVRVYEKKPARNAGALTEYNGIRFAGIPVPAIRDVHARLAMFSPGAVQTKNGRLAFIVTNADGAVFEVFEAKEAPLEIGLIVPDAKEALLYYREVMGYTEMPSAESSVLAGEKEHRFTTGGTTIRILAPMGARGMPAEKISEALGFSYITHNIEDANVLYARFTGKGLPIASPLAAFSASTSLFIARGPGGALLEFVSPVPAASSPGKPKAIPSQMKDLFTKLDKNADGLITAEELPDKGRFTAMDMNGDGSVTLEEAALSISGTGKNKPITGKEPEANAPKDRAFLDFSFKTDHYAGAIDPDSPLAKATEANVLVAHNGLLYCAISYMPSSKKLMEANPKILVKRSAASPWEVDFEAGSAYLRLGFLTSIAFTTDGQGKKLAAPVSVLVAGTGAWRSQPTGVEVYSRNDATSKWTRTILSTNRWNRERVNHTTETRCIFGHVDRVTGVHYVFAGSATGRIFRGVYDASLPGLIRWDELPEIDGLAGHVLCAAEANGVQYAGIAYGATSNDVRQEKERKVKDHGLFRRVDGPTARWEWIPIKEWEDPAVPGRSLRTAQLRGMTAIPDAKRPGKQSLLLAWDTRDAVIERIDISDKPSAVVELNVREYLTKEWGRAAALSTFAYNDMRAAVHPKTLEAVNLIGLWVLHPDKEANELGKSSWYLVRYADASYRYQRVWDAANPLTNSPYGLRGLRSICASPFAGESNVWYFCGFDQTGTRGDSATGPCAWIYKGTLKE